MVNAVAREILNETAKNPGAGLYLCGPSGAVGQNRGHRDMLFDEVDSFRS